MTKKKSNKVKNNSSKKKSSNSSISSKKNHQILYKKIDDLTQINYIISHNLKSNISSIRGLCNIFSLPNFNYKNQNEIIKKILSLTNGIEETINDLNIIINNRLLINKARENINLPNFIHKTTLPFKDQIANCGGLLEIKISKRATNICCLKSYIESIICNIISNSIKYRRKDENLKISINVNVRKSNLIFTFKDNGIGINLKKHKSEIFQLYKRFNKDIKGKGIGLFMTKNQIESLGGTIKVKSELGKGAIFTVILPQ